MKLELELSLKGWIDKERDTGKGILLLGERKAHAWRLCMVCLGSIYIGQHGYSRLFSWNLNLHRLLKSDWEGPSSTGSGESLKEFKNDGGLEKQHFGVICLAGIYARWVRQG